MDVSPNAHAVRDGSRDRYGVGYQYSQTRVVLVGDSDDHVARQKHRAEHAQHQGSILYHLFLISFLPPPLAAFLCPLLNLYMVSLHAADVAVHSFDVSGPGFSLTLPSRSVRSALRTLEYALLVLVRVQSDPPTAFHEALHTSLSQTD